MSAGKMIELLEQRRLLSSNNALIEAGMHRLLQFDLVNTRVYETTDFSSYSTKTVWLLNQNYLVFTNNNNTDNTIAGTAGDDRIIAHAGEAGDVILTVNGVGRSIASKEIRIDARRGNDVIDLSGLSGVEGLSITIYGGAGDDTIIGSTAAEKIFAGEGNDIVNAGNGRDSVYGEGGDDSIRGNAHNDLLDGGDGADTLRGDDGNDNISGGANSDRLRGSAGNDTLHGGGSRDFLSGEDGDDMLFGESGDDACDGGDGVDFLSGGGGTNSFIGGETPRIVGFVDPYDVFAIRNGIWPT